MHIFSFLKVSKFVTTLSSENILPHPDMTEQTIKALHDLTVQLVRNAQKSDDRFEHFAQQIGTNLGSNGLAPVQPKIFEGTTNSDIFAFLAKFDRFATFFALDAPKRLQALPLFLEGRALCFYDMGDRETLELDAYTEDIKSKCRRLNLP